MNPPALTVRSLRATPVSVPLARPVHTASGTIAHAVLALVDLATEQGVDGRAYLFAYTPLALRPLVRLLDELAPLLAGRPCAPAELARTLGAPFRLLGDTGLVAMALAGIDMAAWDALARAAGLPLARLLGGAPRPVRAYFSQGLDGRERGVELAHECLALGYSAMKIKLGHATLAEDVAVAEAVVSVLGERAELAVDYNQSLTVPEALRRCRALDPLGLAWIEEPTRHDDAGHARIAAAIDTPVMLGENWFGVHEMARSLRAQASDLAMPDLMKIGGVSGWLHAAGLAAAARMPMASHVFPEMSAHMLCVTPTAHLLEVLDLAAPVLAEPLVVRDGFAHPGEAPGSGIDWDRDAVSHYRLD